MSLVLKVHKTDDGRFFLTIIDRELIGKKFEEGELQLDLTSPYYQGEDADEEYIIRAMSKAYSISFVGKNAIELGAKNGHVDKEHALVIKGIPTIQTLSMS